MSQMMGVTGGMMDISSPTLLHRPHHPEAP